MCDVEKEVFEKLAKRLRDQGFEVKQSQYGNIYLKSKVLNWRFSSFHNFIFGVESETSVFQASKFFDNTKIQDTELFGKEVQQLSKILSNLEPFSSYEELLFKLEIAG